jgi:Spy/CpxP family protein refolding chaperone
MEANKGNRKAVLLVVLVFALGISLGSVGTYVLTTRVHAARMTEHNPANHMAMFTRDLNLNLDQQKQIQAILTETRARYAEIHKRDDPEYEQARQQGRQRIRQVLTDEQRAKFEDLLRRMDADRLRRQSEAHD